MKKIIVKSLFDAFEYVTEHFYTPGREEHAVKQDTYVVISIQDAYTNGVGFNFAENNFCKGVLTLLVDDKESSEDGDESGLFNEEHAMKIISFIDEHRSSVDTLLVHCYGGQSRSAAVGAFAVKMLHGDNSEAFVQRTPNMLIYNTLEKVWNAMKNTLETEDDINGKNSESAKLVLEPHSTPDFTKLYEFNTILNGSDTYDLWDRNKKVSEETEKRVQKGREMFLKGHNCAQSVVGAFSDIIDVDFVTLMKICDGMGGGMGRMRLTCGAVVGMAVMAGLTLSSGKPKDLNNRTALYTRIREMASEFHEKNGSIVCSKLLGSALPNDTDARPEERTEAYYKKRPCPDYIADCIMIIQKYLFSEY